MNATQVREELCANFFVRKTHLKGSVILNQILEETEASA